jgi:hypothetical protein
MLKRLWSKQTIRRVTVGAGVAAALSLAVALPLFALAPTPPAAAVLLPMLDPWVPPEQRKPSTTPPSEGAELRAQVERKLKAGFDAAAGTTGTLTRAQASAAGLGLIARNFDAIDRTKSGTIRFEDVKQFLQQRGAQFN